MQVDIYATTRHLDCERLFTICRKFLSVESFVDWKIYFGIFITQSIDGVSSSAKGCRKRIRLMSVLSPAW